MTKRSLLEICVETLDAALAAARGGADRIELCEELCVGGVTPSAELMRAVRAKVELPVFAMIRPRGGDFLYSESEFEQMVQAVATVKSCGLNGAVLGILDTGRRVDAERTRTLVERARPLPVTFHRAFDEAPDLLQALEQVIASGARRILTSGGKPNAESGSAMISELVKRAGVRIEILAGGGINPANLACLAQNSGAREFHSGLSSALPYPQTDSAAFEAEVRKLSEVLKRCCGPRDQRQAVTTRERH
jgi:copper homeostasis protein